MFGNNDFSFWYNQTVDDFLNKNITIANPIEQLPTKKEYILNEIDKAYNSALNYHK